MSGAIPISSSLSIDIHQSETLDRPENNKVSPLTRRIKRTSAQSDSASSQEGSKPSSPRESSPRDKRSKQSPTAVPRVESRSFQCDPSGNTYNSVEMPISVSSGNTYNSVEMPISVSVDFSGCRPIIPFLERADHIYNHKRHDIKALEEKEVIDIHMARRNELHGESETEAGPVDKIYRTLSETDETKRSAEELLLDEAYFFFDLAERQLLNNDKQEAAQNYHSACVYFRVLSSRMNQLNIEMNPKVSADMEYALRRTRECSNLLQNCIVEHFSGKKFSEVYRLGKKIGNGKFGTVHECRHTSSQVDFASKTIIMDRINSIYLRKLCLEISIMKNVDHPNVIGLREVFYGRSTVYLVMELCSGGSLFEYLIKKRKLSEEDCVRIIRQILLAVKYLHEHGIVHRDLKLENFIFEKDSPTAVLKIIDFGLSKYYQEHEIMNNVLGSPEYIAPEVIQGQSDKRCDLWSIGVIAYTLLCSAFPFPFNGNLQQTFKKILHDAPDYARMQDKSCNAVDFVKGLLEKRAETRMTIDLALQHPFLMPSPAAQQVSDNHNYGDIVKSMSLYMRLGEVKKVILRVIALKLSHQQIEEVRNKFNAIDTDSSGTISMTELKDAVKSVRGNEIDDSFSDFDNLTQEINYSEFLAAAILERINVTQESLLLAFECLDPGIPRQRRQSAMINNFIFVSVMHHVICFLEGDGFISSDRLSEIICKELGQDNSTGVVEEILAEIKRMDVDENGRIDYAEFLTYWDAHVRMQQST